jgi:putative ABC transport system ATP-binding protein
LADEPTGNLDSTSTADILDLFHELNEEGRTIVLITHERDIAARAQRLIQIEDGDIVPAESAGTLLTTVRP